jgi:hypothetical protein
MTASNFSTYIERNAQFAATDAKDHVPEIPFIPSKHRSSPASSST